MSRNAAVRLSIVSSVAAVLLFLGMATQWARHDNIVNSHQTIEVMNDPATPECVADCDGHQGAITPEVVAPNGTEAQDDDTTKVRRAAIEWVKNKYPEAKVEGVFMLAFAKGNLYLAGADTQFGGDKRRTVDVLVRRYTKRGGGQYFRAEGLEPEQAAQMRLKADFDADTTEEATIPTEANGSHED